MPDSRIEVLLKNICTKIGASTNTEESTSSSGSGNNSATVENGTVELGNNATVVNGVLEV